MTLVPTQNVTNATQLTPTIVHTVPLIYFMSYRLMGLPVSVCLLIFRPILRVFCVNLLMLDAITVRMMMELMVV